MRFAGIDIAAEEHVVAVVDEAGGVVLKPAKFAEDAGGYEKLRELLGSPDDVLVAMEATGHYWQNLFAALTASGFRLVVINPLRTRRFAEEDLARAKTDAIDAVGIARFLAQKRPKPVVVSEQGTQELRALVRHRDRLVQSFGDASRKLHQLVDLGFPEFTRHVKDPSSQLGTAILAEYPTAQAFVDLAPKRLAKLVYDGRHKVGPALSASLIAAAKVSVGAHHGHGYRVQVRHLCEELGLLRRQLRELDRDIAKLLEQHEVGKLLTSIDGIGPDTAARIIAEVGNPADFKSPGALAAYVGVAPRTSQSGKRRPARAPIASFGHAKLRTALWMPTLTAVRKNTWLKAFYERLRADGKLPKVALIAAMRKLLAAIYSVAKNKREFVPHVGSEGAPA